MPRPTLVGRIDSVKGGVLTIRLRESVPTFMMVDGHSYRVAQVGAFLRIPLGYTQLYAVCTLVGAAAAPIDEESAGRHWLSATLFGESIGGVFERGVSQYPTIDDEAHLVTPDDMRVIYGAVKGERAITIGQIAAASGIDGQLDLGRLVTRHFAVVGSTGSGKSNLLAVLVDAICTQGFPAARVLVYRSARGVCVLGIDTMGAKHPLGLWEGATENATVCQGLLTNLGSRGLRTDRSLLVIVDGAKALDTAVTQTFGRAALVQRCQVHKGRNILEHLPEAQRPWVKAVLTRAYTNRGTGERPTLRTRIQ